MSALHNAPIQPLSSSHHAGCLWVVDGRLGTNGEIALPCSPRSDDGYGLGICTFVCPVEERMDLLLQHNRASFITNCRSTSPVMPKLQPSTLFVRGRRYGTAGLVRFRTSQGRDLQFLSIMHVSTCQYLCVAEYVD